MTNSGLSAPIPLILIAILIAINTFSVTATTDLPHTAILKSSCSTTLHPELCYSTLSDIPHLSKTVKTPKDVIELAVNRTKETVERNYFTIKKITLRPNLTKREKIALHDCLEMVSDTLRELNEITALLEAYPTKKGIRRHVDDMLTLMSTTLTNQETCVDGFSHDKHDEQVRESLIAGEVHAEKLCSNSLAMLKNMTDTDMAENQVEMEKKGRKLLDDKWPEWLSAGDRRLLQSGTVTPNVVVAADGSGDFTTVSAAVAAAPSSSSSRYVIRIAAGVYRENVDIPSGKRNLMFLGSGRTTTIITASRSVVGGSTTFNSATVGVGSIVNHFLVVYVRTAESATRGLGAMSGQRRMTRCDSWEGIELKGGPHSKPPPPRVALSSILTFTTKKLLNNAAAVGAGFLARDITFQNTAGPSGQQAVALRVGSDLSAFYRCDMLAYQDTLYVHSNRQFYINCYIAGTVDFIFGNAAAVLQDCDIHARRPNPGQRNMVTAQGRSDPNQNTGIVIQKSRIGATSDLLPVQGSFPSYLGRPWREYSRTVVMQSTISNVINPAGWFPWNGDFALNTLYYGEYQNTGAGADTSNRVTWAGYRVITSATEAQGFTAGSFIGGGNWLAGTGFPFSLGL
ncbi:hypothetical protein OSB04_030379 [Centaurea solstitialis]|uniref:Pectinesterase n=1 Tax=Centaurea solstitialis TaxID=347529 RepID=A0AA38SKJ1_9ASTR|nr:hypothetical protein OSB04_030379 [Centaurea solstitialis]